MSTALKLSYLADTKTAIQNAIIAQGVPVGDEDTFRSYGEKIGAITPSASIQTVTMSVDLVTQTASTYTAYLAQTEAGGEKVSSILGDDTSVTVSETQVVAGSLLVRAVLTTTGYWKTLYTAVVPDGAFNVTDDTLVWTAVA